MMLADNSDFIHKHVIIALVFACNMFLKPVDLPFFNSSSRYFLLFWPEIANANLAGHSLIIHY